MDTREVVLNERHCLNEHARHLLKEQLRQISALWVSGASAEGVEFLIEAMATGHVRLEMVWND